MRMSKNIKRMVASITVFLMVVVSVFTPINFVYAAQNIECDGDRPAGHMMDRFANVNNMFYNPCENVANRRCDNVGGGNNQNYAGATIYSDAQLQAIEANRPFYENSAKKYDFPWQILAVLHYRETRLARVNPNSGQGAYELYSYTKSTGVQFLPAGAIDDNEFQRQTDIAAGVVAEKARGLDLNSDAGVKTLFFRYNGVASVYVKQALNLGFTAEEASHGEGSPYVMNRYDERRDPTVEPTKSNGTWGQIKKDNGPIEYPANVDFGSYVYYMAIGGSVGDCNSGELASGGMTKEQAEEFIKYYYNVAAQYEGKNENVVLDGVSFAKYDSCSSALNNCVAYSRWFLGKYTTIGPKVVGTDGGGLAKLVANTYGLELSQTPRAYAIFSYWNPKAGCPNCGHTGVVLGVDEAAGVIYTGEAACGRNYTLKDIGVKTRKISDVTGGKWWYAYTDTILKGGL